MKRTPLYDVHVGLGARMIGFGGWEMPVSYTDIVEEHLAVRSKAGLFDLSHMGEIEISGTGALELIQRLTTNDASKLAPGQVQYSLMLYPDGGIVDDLLVYRFAGHYMLVVNASNTGKDFEWIREHASGDVAVRDVSHETALVAIQGPFSESILQRVTDFDLSSLGYYRFAEASISVLDGKARRACVISRTGYTGEDGFEIYIDRNYAREAWETLLETGKPEGLVPVGLGARDSLRLEAAYSLYGHEINEETLPYEAGLGWVVKVDKGDFVGREALLKAKERGLVRKLVGLELVERGVPRAGFKIVKGAEEVGYLTSGTFSPSLQKGIGLGYVSTQEARPGNELAVMIRNKPVGAKVVKTPFVESHVKK
ncbi:MAG TPA: glycine cleavage system aminomethyltransferase GcvT [Firmicutes bacterium]|nr:glycine cleavage system aminomethyltransferase GcvT [Bacillota bacterium]